MGVRSSLREGSTPPLRGIIANNCRAEALGQGPQFRVRSCFVTADELKDVEIFVGTLRKSLSNGGVKFDENDNLFYVFVNQKETFLFLGDTNVQARILYLSGDVVGVNLGTINFERSTSKVVLK